MSILITWADVVGVAPASASVSAAGQALILEFVEEQLDPVTWGNRLKAGQTYLAAHLATLPGVITALSGGGGAAGPVVSESVGQLSRSYANLTSAGSSRTSATSTDMTPHGREYLRLVRTLPGAILGLVT